MQSREKHASHACARFPFPREARSLGILGALSLDPLLSLLRWRAVPRCRSASSARLVIRHDPKIRISTLVIPGSPGGGRAPLACPGPAARLVAFATVVRWSQRGRYGGVEESYVYRGVEFRTRPPLSSEWRVRAHQATHQPPPRAFLAKSDSNQASMCPWPGRATTKL